MATASTIDDLVAMVADRVDPAGLVERAELAAAVREHRTEGYEAHEDGGEVLAALCERVTTALG